MVGFALPAFAADKPIVVGFSQIGAESGWRTANTESIKSEAAKRGIDLKFADAQQKQENQIKALRSFIAQDVDVIAFSPVVETGWEPVMREIKKAGIPVVLIGGTLLSGGVGFMAGTAMGVLILGLIQTLITFQGNLNTWWTRIVVGVLVLVFILLQNVISSASGRLGETRRT